MDGECKMLRRVQRVEIRYKKAALRGFYGIWCGLHQLNTKLQAFFVSLMDEQFNSNLISLITYLRSQQDRIEDTKTKTPTITDTLWDSFSKAPSWFKTNHVEVLAYLNQN